MISSTPIPRSESAAFRAFDLSAVVGAAILEAGRVTGIDVCLF
jgi:hypothetical protein